MPSKLETAQRLGSGIVSALGKRPVGQHIRTQEQRLAQSLRSQKQGEKYDTFRYEGKTYPKSEGVKAFYKTDRIRSGIGYTWVPKSVRGGKGGGTGIPQQVEERKLIKSKLQGLTRDTLKGMYGPDLVKHIKSTLNLERHPITLQQIQQEVIGGGWKIGMGQRGSAGPDYFTYRGKVYPKSEGVFTTYINKGGQKQKRWSPKASKGMAGKNIGYLDPVISAERESIKSAFEKMDKETLKKMSGNELLAAINKIPGINRNTIPYDLREEVIGAGWKPKKGKKLIEGRLARYSGINSLSPENFTKVEDFLAVLTQAHPGKRSYNALFPIVDRMIKFAKRKGVSEEKIIKKLYETDIEGIGNIVVKNYELKKLYREAKALGLDPDMTDLTHIDAISRNWEKGLDPSNLIFANYKSNRNLQKAIEEQITILKKAIPQAKSLADKKIMATAKVVLDPTKRKPHMYEYYKPRTLAEMREDLARGDVVSEIGGTRYGAKIDPNDPYFAEKVAAKLRSEIDKRRAEINLQAAHTTLNRGGIVNGYSKGGKVMKLLDDAIGMMSRRKFMKGTGAVALSAALPKSAMKLAAPLAKKVAHDFAPPWVNGMLSALKSVTKEQVGTKMIPSIMGNKAEIIKLDAKAYKLYKNQTGKETHFRVKTADYKMHDDVTIAKGEAPPYSYDDIILREEPGQTSITWKNKEYDHGNDQHIVIDKINKETRFIDDNWHMEAGGEDIAKDDWIEYILPGTSKASKKNISREMGLAKGDKLDNKFIDAYSVDDMDNYYADTFKSYVDSFSPSGNVFGTVNRMVKKIKKKDQLRQQKKWNDEQVRNLKEKEMLDWEDQFRGGKGIHAYDKGGIARRPNAVPPLSGPDPYATLIEDSVSQIRSNPSEYMGSQFIQKFNKGGFVKKNAPKIIGKLTNYRPKLTMSDVLKNIQKAKKVKPPANPYIIYDQALTPLKKFKTRDEAQTWLNRNYTADSNIHPEVVHYEKAKTTLKSMEPKAEEPGAMFWGSREKIIGAPSEAMTGLQWIQYLKIGKHGILNPKGYPRIKDMELNDTSLAPWLSRAGNKTVSKPDLVKQFDEMAPTMEVTVLGESTGGRIFDDMRRTLEKVDTQAIRNPAIKGFYDYIKAVLPQLRSSQTGKAADEIATHIDDMVYRNFGVENALEAGVPQRFPFEIKELLQKISTGLGKRTAGFKTYKRSPQHRETQTMAGGDNYREFLFKYKPGSLRQKEPQYKYHHDFNLESADRMGGIVHTRTSDRADQFGRRLLHIEEIQSDMHQKVNMAQRTLKKKHLDWAKEGKTPEGEYKKMTKSRREEYDELVAQGKYAPRGDLEEQVATANEQHLLLIKSKIDDLLVQKQSPAIITRLNRLKKERTKVREIIEDEKKKMAEGAHSGVPQGPLSKTEDYNEFIMKYMLRVAREGGYDGITINTPAIKNLGMTPTGRDYKGNLVAYGPMARGAMQKAAKKSGAKFMKTVIMDENNRAWEVPMILIKENKAAQALIDKGLPIYKKGGIVKK